MFSYVFFNALILGFVILVTITWGDSDVNPQSVFLSKIIYDIFYLK